MSILARAPVIASNPVANTRQSNSYSRSPARSPRGVISSIGASLTSTSSTLSRLKVA